MSQSKHSCAGTNFEFEDEYQSLVAEACFLKFCYLFCCCFARDLQLGPLDRSFQAGLLSVSALHEACQFANPVMTSKRDSGRFLKTSACTANWYLDFQDGKMDVRTGERAQVCRYPNKSGKSNVFRHSSNPAAPPTKASGNIGFPALCWSLRTMFCGAV